MIQWTLLLLASAAAWGQSVEIPASSVDRGSASIFRVILKPQTDKPVVALQWEVVFNPQDLRIDPSDVVAGDVAESAGKSITCAARHTKAGEDSCICILAGGVKALAQGTIAIVRFRAPAGARAGTAKLELQRVSGVSADLNKVRIADVAASITIR